MAASLPPVFAWSLQQAGEEGASSGAMPMHPGTPTGAGKVHRAWTDRGRPILLASYPNRPVPAAEAATSEERWLRQSGLSAALVRTAPPTAAYYCHDWVFTGGRYSLLDTPVETILQDNGYEQPASPQAGDLVVYRQKHSGSVMHTGVVHSVGAAGVLVESKWAWMGRYLHPADVYYPEQAVCSYFRSGRTGHLLRGLDGETPDARGGLAQGSRKKRAYSSCGRACKGRRRGGKAARCYRINGSSLGMGPRFSR